MKRCLQMCKLYGKDGDNVQASQYEGRDESRDA